MRIRNAELTDASKLSLLMNEGFGWENTKPYETSIFNNNNIICLIAENDQGETWDQLHCICCKKLIEDLELLRMWWSLRNSGENGWG